MKWLKSTTDKSYTAQGKIIPPSTQAPLAVNEDTYNSIIAMPVIKSLITNGGIIVLDKYTDMGNTADAQTRKLQSLTAENTKLASRIRELENAQASKKTSKADAKLTAALEEKEAELKALQEKYAALEAEANAKIAELSEGKA